MKTTFMLIPALLLFACAPRAAFVRTGEGQRPAKTVDQIATYFDGTPVPFEFVEVGRIFMDIKPGKWMSTTDQLSEIKARAAEMGADAAIVKTAVVPYSHSRTDGMMLSRSEQTLIPVFSAVAIAKK